MAKYDLDVSEVEEYARVLREHANVGAIQFTGVAQKYRTLTMKEARRRAPYRTGELHDSIQPVASEASRAGYDARWEVTADHAAPIEYGHILVAWGRRTDRFIPPQPYVRPALAKYRRQYIEDLAREAKENLGVTKTGTRRVLRGARRFED